MKTNVKSIANHRDLIKRKKRLKTELKLIILTSLFRNRTLKPTLRSIFKFKFISIWRKNYSISYQQNICVASGKKKTTFKISSLSRQLTKRFIEHGFIQSIKIK